MPRVNILVEAPFVNRFDQTINMDDEVACFVSSRSGYGLRSYKGTYASYFVSRRNDEEIVSVRVKRSGTRYYYRNKLTGEVIISSSLYRNGRWKYKDDWELFSRSVEVYSALINKNIVKL